MKVRDGRDCRASNEISNQHIMNGHEAQAGLTMPRHAPAPDDYDIWVAQKPPMLIDWPR